MNRLINFFLLLSLLSCEISEKIDLTINYRPTLVGNYEIFDDRGNEVMAQRIEHVYVWVYYQDNTLFKELSIRKDELRDSGYFFLDGVPEGNYHVVSMANVSNIKLHIDDENDWRNNTVYWNNGSAETHSMDSVYHSCESFLVKRGNIILRKLQMKNKGCKINLDIMGENPLDDQNYKVNLLGARDELNFAGGINDELTTITPQLQEREDGHLASTFHILRPVTQDPLSIELTLKEQDGSSRTFVQSLKPYLETINMERTPDMVLDIKINLRKTNFTISIQDWEANLPQVEEVGA